MKLVSTLSILFVLFMSSKANYANPFSNTFRGGAVAANINTASSGLPNFTSANTVAAPQVTTTTTTVNIPAPVAPQVVQQPAVPTGHSHPIPNFGPPPMTPPVSASWTSSCSASSTCSRNSSYALWTSLYCSCCCSSKNDLSADH